jgi:hypothetical protein
MLTNEQKSTELYRLAYVCEQMKAKGCGGFCANCQFNVSLYADNSREAVLIKTSASIDYNKRAEYQKKQDDKGLIYLGIFLAIVTFIIVQCNTPKKPKVAPQDTLKTYNTVDLYSLVLRAQFSSRDVNGDGIINCIDYAVRFSEMCPEARIIHNINRKTGMDHLLNRVGVTYIEPQGDFQTMDPKVFWGSKYDPDMNMDETHYWKERYARK